MADLEKTQRKGRGSNPNSKANLKPFKKGQSGNPSGPAPCGLSLTDPIAPAPHSRPNTRRKAA